MPQLTLLLGRKTIQSYDMDQPVIRVGRDESVDIVIDNPSVSRNHVEIRREGDRWTVQDLGSSNGTFLNGKRIETAQPLTPGDEIGIGKFSIIFEKELASRKAEAARAEPAPAATETGPPAGGPDLDGTMHIKPHEVKEILDESSKRRRAHLVWQAGGQKGTHHFSDARAALVGRDELCDVQVPKGPKHHILVIHSQHGWEVRNLAFFGGMKVRGSKTKRARLKDGDIVEAGGLKLTFVGELA